MSQELYLSSGQKVQMSEIDFSKLEKIAIESHRYKQDCRKRALDLAHSQLTSPQFQNFILDNEFIKKDGTKDDKSVVSDTLLIALADKYYAWLTADIS
jgi:hypothetical protein